MRTDHFLVGFASGLIAPLIGFYFYYQLFFAYMGFQSFYKHVSSSDKLISVLSLGVILNLVLFFIFYQTEKDRSLKGVVGATFVYAFLVLYYKMIR